MNDLVMASLIVVATLVFRGIGDVVDGFSDRAVSSWLWHALNWMRRDLVVAGIYIWLLFGSPGKRLDLDLLPKVLILVMLALVNYLLHKSLYNWAYKNRQLFP